MSFCKYDAGKDQIIRHHKGDCTVRALATASRMSYLDAWTLLSFVQQQKKHCSFQLFDYLREDPERFGVKRYISFPAKRGVPRTKLIDFQHNFPKGRFVVQVAHHATAVMDGTCYDTWNPARKTVYGAWEMR